MTTRKTRRTRMRMMRAGMYGWRIIGPASVLESHTYRHTLMFFRTQTYAHEDR